MRAEVDFSELSSHRASLARRALEGYSVGGGAGRRGSGVAVREIAG